MIRQTVENDDCFQIKALCFLSWYSDDEPPSDGKIVFKKPAKRASSDKFQGISASSTKKKKHGEEEDKRESKSGAKVKNKSLLSFGGDDEEDED